MHGLVVQLQVIHALIMREIKTRFGTHRLGYVWALLAERAGTPTP